MKIRSITCFCNPLIENFQESLKNFSKFLSELKSALGDEGWEVQTTRLATTPFGYFANGKARLKLIQDLEDLAGQQGFTYLSAGPARLFHEEEYQEVPEILASTQNVFLSAPLTHPRKDSRQHLRAHIRTRQKEIVFAIGHAVQRHVAPQPWPRALQVCHVEHRIRRMERLVPRTPRLNALVRM